MIKFSHTTFYVKDVTKALKFYKDTFGFEPRFVFEGNQYAELETGETSIAFTDQNFASAHLVKDFIKNDINQLPFAFEIAFTVSDVKQYYDKALSVGATNVTEPMQKPWGMLAYVRDPNGVLIELASPMPME